MNEVTVDVSRLPESLRIMAEAWRKSGASVAARKDDAGEFRIMKLRPGETVWVGWYPVFFDV